MNLKFDTNRNLSDFPFLIHKGDLVSSEKHYMNSQCSYMFYLFNECKLEVIEKLVLSEKK